MLLSELFDVNRIKLNERVRDWRDAIVKVGQLLVESNLVEERYINAMIKVAEEYGPYIVLAPGFAMPHARPEDGCLGTGMAMITLAEPINFGNPDNDPVRVVIALSAKNETDHIIALSQLAELLSTDKWIEKVSDAQSSKEVMDLIQSP